MSEIIKVPISKVKPNPKNPRVIKDDKFQKLVKSITEFPGMLEKRPLVVTSDVDGKYVVLGGNMRLKAAKEVGIKQIEIITADDWTEEQKAEFLIKDNVSFGEWDWDQLANEWDVEKLEDWALNVTDFKFDDALVNNDNGDIVELDKIVTTFNINIKCDSPDELEEMKFKLGITSNSIHSSMLIGLLA